MGESRIIVPSGTKFNEGFADRFHSGPIRTEDFTCPTVPTTTKVSREGRSNYATFQNNTQNYGITGLMAVKSWNTTCYGQILPGYVFLFPGTYESNPPAYSGTVSINCVATAPMVYNGTPLHQMMCNLLGQPATNFIGFYINGYPFSVSGVGYNSCTCNITYFGSCTVSTNCNGTNWQSIISSTLQTWLG